MPDKVTVTQADREAAARMWLDLKERCEPLAWQAEWMLDGTGDTGLVVQAFARHRIASQQPVPNSVVEALTNDTSLQAIMASEFKVCGIDAGIPTTALQACMVHVLEAAATLQQSGQTEAELLREALNTVKHIIEVSNDLHDAAENYREAARPCWHGDELIPNATLSEAVNTLESAAYRARVKAGENPFLQQWIARIDTHLNATQGEGA